MSFKRWLLASVWTVPGFAVAGDLAFIEVGPGRPTALRESATQTPFVAVGVNYFDPEVGWAPKLWQQFDENRVARHLQLLHDHHFNTIRVFLTYQSFHREPGRIHPDGLGKFRRLLDMCRKREIRVIPSGPDHWEGTPDWRNTDMFADEKVLAADEAWWGAFAAEFRDEPTILAWDLYNEPTIRWDSPAMREKWNVWLKDRYGTTDKIAEAWTRPAAEVGSPGTIEVPRPEPARNDPRLWDYQHFREHIADEWTRRMTAAIRSADRNHPITIGHIQWAVPIMLPGVQHYAGFDLKANARHLDFMTMHFYPMDAPRPCDAPEGIEVNKVYFQALLHLASVGKPLMIGEFNWYGGGGLGGPNAWQLPEKPVEHQVEWCRELLAISRGRVCGWLNWAFADTPTSRDITRWSGCWTTDLRLKPWGEMFSAFARDVIARPDTPRPFPAVLIAFPFDHRAMVTDPAVGNEYRKKLRELYLAGK